MHDENKRIEVSTGRKIFPHFSSSDVYHRKKYFLFNNSPGKEISSACMYININLPFFYETVILESIRTVIKNGISSVVCPQFGPSAVNMSI